MDARRVAAIVSLGLVGTAVVGLIATSGDPSPVAEVADTGSSASPDDTASVVVETDAAAQSEPTIATSVEPAAPTVESSTTVDPDVPVLPDLGPHPEFLEVQEWIQTDATTFDEFDGRVLAVQFWTFGCHNCQATVPHLRDLYEKYAGDDFEIIGVHAPEFDFERDVDAVADYAQENGLVWPIAIDNDKLNFRSWQERRFWPRIFLIDADGNVRYDHIGEGAYDEIDAAVGALIEEQRT